MRAFDCAIEIENARAVAYNPDTDRYLVHSPRFYGGAWVEGKNVYDKERQKRLDKAAREAAEAIRKRKEMCHVCRERLDR